MPTDTLCQGKCIKGLLSDARAPLRMLRKRESASISNVHPMRRGDEKGRYLDEQVFLWETLRARAQICLLSEFRRKNFISLLSLKLENLFRCEEYFSVYIIFM
jgi:hypothetical protein